MKLWLEKRMNRTIMALLFLVLIINPIIVTHVKSEINYEINLSVGKTVGTFIWLNETNIHQIWLSSNNTYVITVTPKDMQNSNISAINTNIRFSIWPLDGFEEELIVERKPSGDPEEWEYKSKKEGVYFINVSTSNNADGYYCISVKKKTSPLETILDSLDMIFYGLIILVAVIILIKIDDISRYIRNWFGSINGELPRGVMPNLRITKRRRMIIGLIIVIFWGATLYLYYFHNLEKEVLLFSTLICCTPAIIQTLYYILFSR